MSVPFFLIILGLVLALFASARAALDGRPATRPWMDIFRRFSRYSLTLYVLHYAVLVLPQRLAGWWIIGDAEALLRNSLTVPQGLVLGPLLIPLFYGLCRLWDRVKGRFSMEWWIEKFVGK
jgi:hypothetical protein